MGDVLSDGHVLGLCLFSQSTLPLDRFLDPIGHSMSPEAPYTDNLDEPGYQWEEN